MKVRKHKKGLEYVSFFEFFLNVCKTDQSQKLET